MMKILFLFLFPSVLIGQTQIGTDINGENASDEFGTSVSLSSNGNILAIGSEKYSGTKGYVRVFENQSNVWTQIGGNIEGESNNDKSGISVSLSSDGTILAIGADANDANGGNNNGHVRVFKYNGVDTWNQLGQDIDGEATGDGSGFRVSLSSDGTIVAISARANDGGGNLSGHVRIFKYNGVDTWNQLGNDIDGEATSDQSGESLDISSDGTIVAIGSVNNTSFKGHVRVFEYNGVDTWSQIGSDIDGELASEQFGSSISLSSNGNVIAIGAALSPSFSKGRVRIYENQSGTWTKIGSDIIGSNFYQLGSALHISSDGTIVAIGAIGQFGRVLVYENQSGTWTQVGSTINGDTAGDSFSSSVSLSSNGDIVAIGASKDDNTANNAGLVRVYDLSAFTLSKESFTNDYFSFYPNPTKNILNIELNESLELKNINIYNNLGQFINSSKKNKIDTSHLISGFYFIEVETNQGKSAKKIVIE